MKLKSKTVLFCGELTDSSKAIITTLLEQNIKSIVIANNTEDSLENHGLNDSRLSHYCGDLNKIEDLEAIYSQALKQTRKKLDLVVNHKEIISEDPWEDLITTHINSLICSTLMAIKHLGSMNSGGGGTVLNSVTICDRSDDEYASIHRLLNDLDRSFSDPYYFNNTAVRILTMCTRMESGRGSDANVSAEAENSAPTRADRLLEVFAHKRSVLDSPQCKQTVEEFEISVRN